MTDNEIKEECLTESGIDLGRYSHTELTQIKDALIRYHNVKLKLLGIVVVVGRSEKCGKCTESTGETKLWCCNHCTRRTESF
jgi:hypothetical protein